MSSSTNVRIVLLLPLVLLSFFISPTLSISEQDALKKLMTDYPVLAKQNPSWNDTSISKSCPELNIDGIRCDRVIENGTFSYHIMEIDFSNIPLNGQLPDVLHNFQHLRIVNMNNCSLDGPIVPDLAEIPNLSQLYLEGNKLSGGIPVKLLNHQKLTRLFLRNNSLSGKVPDFQSNINHLMLDNNDLEFSCPTAQWTSKVPSCRISNNKCSAYCPQSRCNMFSCRAEQAIQISELENRDLKISNQMTIFGSVNGGVQDSLTLLIDVNSFGQKAALVTIDCATIKGKIFVEVSGTLFNSLVSLSDPEALKYHLVKSKCRNTVFNGPVFVKAPDECRKLYGKLDISSHDGETDIYVVFSSSHTRCNLWWIITSSVIGIILVVVIVLLVVNPGNMIRPKIKVYY